MSDPDAPLVIVAAPGSGTAVVAAALAAAPQLRRLPAQLLDDLPGLRLADRGFSSHRLTGGDATPVHTAAVRDALRIALATHAPVRPLLSGPRLALRVGFLAAALPRARFVRVNAAREVAIGRARECWRAGSGPRSDLPGWDGPPWTLPVTPGWRELRGLPLDELVSRQWDAIDAALTADLAALSADRVLDVDRRALLRQPDAGLRELAAFAGVTADPAMAGIVATVAADAGQDAATDEPGRHSLRFARTLQRAGGAVVAAVPDPGALVALRVRDGHVTATTTPLPRATGVATHGAGVAVTAGDLWTLRRGPRGRLRSDRHLRADGRTLGEPVLTADRVGCVVDHPTPGLAWWDDEAGLVTAWRPPGRRRRVGGVAVRDGEAAYATTHGGLVVDLRADVVVAGGLELPVAPRWADGALWLLELGGALCRVDVGSGAVERVAQVPGVAYALALAGGVAFVAGEHAGTGRVWAFDAASGAPSGFASLGTPVATGVATLPPPNAGFPTPPR